jgi:serine/threonine protein kinase
MQVAIKIINKSNITTEDQITRCTRELSLLKRFRHPFIAEF